MVRVTIRLGFVSGLDIALGLALGLARIIFWARTSIKVSVIEKRSG